MKYTVALLTAIALVLALAATAQEEEAPSGLFIGRVDVSVVNVEVFVTDRDGQPVTGLTQDDFVILQDGEPVEITNFYAATRPDRLAQDLGKDLDQLRVEPARVATVGRPDQQLNLVVYVDNFNLRPSNRKRVLDDLSDFLERRAFEGDNVMLVGFNRAVDIVQPFTRDPEMIRRGLDTLSKAATYRQVDEAERRRILRLMVEAASDGALDETYAYVRSYVQQTQSNLRLTAKAMQDVLRALAGLPGRKALLYVSDGLPARPGEEMYHQLNDLFSTQALQSDNFIVDPTIEAVRENQDHLFDAITREANAQQVTFYTVDARGTAGSSIISAAEGNISPGPAGNSFLGAMRDLNLQEPLIELAEATGGKSLLNTYDFAQGFGRMAEDFTSFYSLGYRLEEGGDGRYHDIEVIVRHPDYKVRHRAGYVDKPEEERVADRTLSSLMLEATDNPLGIGLTFGAPDKKGKQRYTLPILVRIPLDAVTFLPNGENQEARLKIFVAVQDEKGGISDIHTQPYPMAVPKAQIAAAKGQDIGYSAQLQVRPGTANVAIGVWDEIAGTKSYHHQRVLVRAQ